jgi:hypothetical protein
MTDGQIYLKKLTMTTIKIGMEYIIKVLYN